MEIKRIGVLSCVKLSTIVYTGVGLVGGAFVSGVSLLGSAVVEGEQVSGTVFFGVFAIVVFPIFYGVAGAVGGFLSAVIYNVAARFVGGLILEVEMSTPTPTEDDSGDSDDWKAARLARPTQ